MNSDVPIFEPFDYFRAMSTDWIKRTRSAMKAKKITQETLAEKIGKSQPWLSNRFRQIHSTTIEELALIAKGIDESTAFLLTGQRPISELRDSIPVVPVINWDNILDWPREKNEVEVEEWIYPHKPEKLSTDAYAVRQTGDSMVSFGERLSIPAGTLLVADPAIEASAGDIVIVDIFGKPSCKKLSSDGVTQLFTSLNTTFPPIKTSRSTRILAVVVEALSILHSL